ncbi:hypothetical protein ARMGADRAFT_1041019 [Armillaria gallica]|uniref:Uncharacterized protein n=1 Tax=Armillaria gallica TaxID=47427 RepID=A0A2H3CB74_ARMGA|nr:hypothetical protein ARMGADRAFT_1041019 [Armillaria gallica]
MERHTEDSDDGADFKVFRWDDSRYMQPVEESARNFLNSSKLETACCPMPAVECVGNRASSDICSGLRMGKQICVTIARIYEESRLQDDGGGCRTPSILPVHNLVMVVSFSSAWIRGNQGHNRENPLLSQFLEIGIGYVFALLTVKQIGKVSSSEKVRSSVTGRKKMFAITVTDCDGRPNTLSRSLPRHAKGTAPVAAAAKRW